MKFKDFAYSYENIEKELIENSLYASATEREDLLKDKDKVAEAFIFNFIGILGLLNASTHTRDAAMLRKYFMADKKVRIDTIGDENNDISLVVKLAHEAGFFKNDVIVNQITRFLAKVKLGQITSIDSTIMATWMDGLKPEFIRYIKDPQVRALIAAFIKDGGQTIDVSSISVLMKKKYRKLEMGGEFVPFAKRFKLVERTPADVAAAAGTATPTDGNDSTAATATTTKDPVVDQSKSNFDAVNKTGKVTTKKPMATTVLPTPAPVVEPEKPKYKFPEPIAASYLFVDRIFFNQYGNMSSTLDNSTFRRYNLKPEDKQFILDTRSSLMPDIEALYDPKTVEIAPHINNILNKLKQEGILSSSVTPIELAEYAGATNYFDRSSGRISDEEMKRISITSAIFRKEIGLLEISDLLPLNRSYSSTAADTVFRYIEPLSKSKLRIAKPFIDELIDSMSWYLDGTTSYFQSNIADEKSTLHKGVLLYLLKSAAGNYSFEDIIKLLSDPKNMREYSQAYAFNNLNYILIQYTDDVLAAMPQTVAGYDLHAVVKRHQKEYSLITEINMPEQGKFFSSIISSYASMMPDEKRKKSILFRIIYNRYKADLLQNGLEKSLLASDKLVPIDGYQTRKFATILEDFGITMDDLVARFPNDMKLISLKIEREGPDSVPYDTLKAYVHSENIQKVKSSLSSYDPPKTDEELKATRNYAMAHLRTTQDLFRRSSDSSKIGNLMVDIMEENPAIYDSNLMFENVMRMIPKMEKDEVLRLVGMAKKNSFKNFFDESYYKNTSRRANKDEFVSIFTGIMNDTVDTDVEDYISDILEQMPGGVIGKVRQSLVGINKLVDEVNSGVIKPFGTIDDKRLKIMLSMNDINFAALVTADIGRKKKNERWSDYFKRAKADAGKSGKSALGDEKVVEYQSDTKKLTRAYNNSHRSGRHGDNYTKILKTFDSSLEYPEFKEFRKNNFGDGVVQPAFHGTGGIAATMILRYGFKVIKSTDSSVVGRMLGDGIYFSNKIDKAMQYVGNSGYSRDIGQKGYIIEVDNTLGEKATSSNGPDYRVMGLGGDNIRSPEWCIRDPKKQLAVRKVYEVELISGKTYRDYITEGTTEGMMGFKSYLQERKLTKMDNGMVSFTFRDGLIPIFKLNEETKKLDLDFIDFEDALEQKLIPADMMDYSAQGPVIVFDKVAETKIFDIRFASAMNGEEYKLYEKYFAEKVLKL